MMKELIIFPDIHGRDFWKVAKDDILSGVPCIFLGDYFDPYPRENINGEQAIENFREILGLSEKEGVNITFLLGNHDCTYLYPDERICECRTDYQNYPLIQNLLIPIENKIYLAVKKGDYIFSHAGIHEHWLKEVGIELEDILDKPMNKIGQKVKDWLGCVSSYRGGWGNYSSPVWADIREFQFSRFPYTQIVGHTQQQKNPMRMRDVLCLDCRRAFWMDTEGDIYDYETGKIVP